MCPGDTVTSGASSRALTSFSLTHTLSTFSRLIINFNARSPDFTSPPQRRGRRRRNESISLVRAEHIECERVRSHAPGTEKDIDKERAARLICTYYCVCLWSLQNLNSIDLARTRLIKRRRPRQVTPLNIYAFFCSESHVRTEAFFDQLFPDTQYNRVLAPQCVSGVPCLIMGPLSLTGST
jgi:hypothetical protein